MLCPACHESNPERNRFCGQCGASLRQPVQSRPQNAAASGVRADGQRGSRPSTVEPLPQEVIDYDNRLPLLAEPGMDRRQSFGSLRQSTQQARVNESSEVSPAQTDRSKLFDPPLWSSDAVPDNQSKAPAQPVSTLEEIWNSEMASEAEDHASAPLAAAPGETQYGLNSLDHRPTEAPKNAESPKNVESPAEDLSGFLDFTPTRHDETASLSGPSFLGLSGDAEPVERQPEPGTRRWPRYLASGLIAAIAALMLMHGTSLRDTASRYARVGASYANLLRTGKTSSPTGKSGPPDASAGPASSTPSTPDFVVEQRPANPAQAASDKSPASEAQAAPEAQPAPPAKAASTAPESPANPASAGSGDSPRAAQASETTQTSNSQPQTPAAEHMQLAKTKPPAATSAPARQSRPPQVAGQGEYQQALAATNPEIARALLWRATALGNADAQVRLADMYIYGDGVPQNCDQGLVLLRSAAHKANSRARGKLGALYATGKCVSQNRVEAYRWLSLGLNGNQGSEWTEKNREMVWQQMSPDERSRVTTAISAR